MKIQTQFFILFITFLLLIIGQIIYNNSQQQHNIESIQSIRASEFSETFHEIIDLKTSKPRLFAFDYSYWDELIAFTKTKDSAWAQVNLQQGLTTFESDYIYVYDDKNSLVYSISNPNLPSIASKIDISSLDLDKPILRDYFIRDDTRLIQLFIAPIQNSDDIKRIGKPRGHLIVGKVWTPEFVHDFSKITKQTIFLDNTPSSAENHLSHPLKDSLGNTIAYLNITLSSTADETLHSMLKTNLISIIIVGLIGFGIFGWLVYTQILIPLRAISKAMRSGSPKSLSGLLLKEENEFQKIAQLINAFFLQKEALRNTNQILEKKVEERTRELEQLNRTLDERVKEEISRRREQEQIMIHQSRFAAMGEMIGNIAHQWRQPLNALSLLVQNIVFSYQMGRLDDTIIERANEKGALLINTMSSTIDDFRNFFKPNKSKEIFNIAEHIERTLKMVQASLYNTQITLTSEIDPSIYVEGFSNEFSQVLLNILHNAKDALVEKNIVQKTIHIHSYRYDDTAIITIEDNAGGIATEIIDKIFDPYFTTKEEGKGTGIGLYMSKVIIETNMQGQLIVSNTDNGALFQIVLKRISKEEE